jgi:hypothetical protein
MKFCIIEHNQTGSSHPTTSPQYCSIQAAQKALGLRKVNSQTCIITIRFNGVGGSYWHRTFHISRLIAD